MSLGPEIIEQNTAHVAPATADMSAAQIDDTARRANALVLEQESKEAGMAESKGGGDNAVSILLDAGLDALAPGLRPLVTAAQVGMGRYEDNMQSQDSSKPKSMDEHITGSFKQSPSSGQGLLSSINNARDSLFGTAGSDKHAGGLTGAKSNKTNIPTDASAANQLTRSVEKIQSVKNHHKQALDSVPVAQAALGAVRSKAMEMAPGMSLGSGPSFNANQILQEAEKYRDEQRGRA